MCVDKKLVKLPKNRPASWVKGISLNALFPRENFLKRFNVNLEIALEKTKLYKGVHTYTHTLIYLLTCLWYNFSEPIIY